MNTGPIFIIGAPRSGTTLLQYMLRSHPRISFPTGESHFMVPVYRNSASYGNLQIPANMRKLLADIYRRGSDFIDSELHGFEFNLDVLTERFCEQNLTTVPNVIRRLMELNAHGEGKVRWGEKTPYYALHVPMIMEMFPDAKIIHIIRDGRDCALSMLERRYDLDIHNIYEAARIWNQYVTSGQSAGQLLSKKTYHEFHYENLLNNKVDVVKGICAFLGEDFSESVIEFKKPSCRGKTPLLKRPIQSDNTDKWKEQMTRRQLRIFEAEAGNTLVRNGYDLATGKNHLQALINLPYRLHQRYYSQLNKKRRRKNNVK